MQSRCDALHALLTAAWTLAREVAKAHGMTREQWGEMKREILETNMPELRRCWGHAGIAKAIQAARDMGVRG